MLSVSAQPPGSAPRHGAAGNGAAARHSMGGADGAICLDFDDDDPMSFFLARARGMRLSARVS